MTDEAYMETCIKCHKRMHILRKAGTDEEATTIELEDDIDGWMHMGCYNALIDVVRKWLKE